MIKLKISEIKLVRFTNKQIRRFQKHGILKTCFYHLKKPFYKIVRPRESIKKPNFIINLFSNQVQKTYKNFIEESFPKAIQIQTITGCNYSCPFCPANKPNQSNYGEAKAGKKMPLWLFKKIINDLAEKEFSGTLCPFLMNEPLLDKRILNLIKYSRDKLPNANISLLTNGGLINENLINKLSLYVNNIVINNYPAGKDMRKIIDFNKLSDSSKRKVRIKNYTYREKLTNRAGNISNNPLQKSLNLFCYRPFEIMYIGYDGQVILCCQDWKFEVILGDLKKESIKKIWNGNKYKNIRENLFKNKRTGLCGKCDYIGYRGIQPLIP